MFIYPAIYKLLNGAKRIITNATTTVKIRETEAELEHAQFAPFFQPIYSHDGKISGCEVLLRIETEGAFQSPYRHIAFLEKMELMNDILISLINDVTNHFSRHKDSIPDGFYFSFNITANQLLNHTVTDSIRSFATEFKGAARVVLEIVERERLVLNDEVLDIMDDMIAHGVMFAIDDFGTGTSSLKYLEHVGFSLIKLDKSLTIASKDELVYKNVIKAIVALSNSLNIKLIAEGVESNGQHNLLKNEGIDYMQGFYLDKPMGILDFKNRLSLLNASSNI